MSQSVSLQDESVFVLFSVCVLHLSAVSLDKRLAAKHRSLKKKIVFKAAIVYFKLRVFFFFYKKDNTELSACF